VTARTSRRSTASRRATPAVQILVAVPSPAVARRLSAALLDARLCACAQTVGPITSRYVWRGQRATTREWLLLVKTRRALFGAVERAVRALHPYTVPEIAATPLAPVHAPYLAWLVDATTAPARNAPRRTASRTHSVARAPRRKRFPAA
jgi:periplasmic divalent cation tolerance protein